MVQACAPPTYYISAMMHVHMPNIPADNVFLPLHDATFDCVLFPARSQRLVPLLSDVINTSCLIPNPPWTVNFGTWVMSATGAAMRTCILEGKYAQQSAPPLPLHPCRPKFQPPQSEGAGRGLVPLGDQETGEQAFCCPPPPPTEMGPKAGPAQPPPPACPRTPALSLQTVTW